MMSTPTICCNRPCIPTRIFARAVWRQRPIQSEPARTCGKAARALFRRVLQKPETFSRWTVNLDRGSPETCDGDQTTSIHWLRDRPRQTSANSQHSLRQSGGDVTVATAGSFGARMTAGMVIDRRRFSNRQIRHIGREGKEWPIPTTTSENAKLI